MTKKTLKDFLEVYKPKSPDEQKFVDKHVTIKHKDRNGNGDDVFNGNTKYIKRKEERKGYDVGEDEKVYEEVEEMDERFGDGDERYERRPEPKPAEKKPTTRLGQFLQKRKEKAAKANIDKLAADYAERRRTHRTHKESVEEVEEARVYPGDYHVTSEKSQFGGHRPKVVHKDKGHTMYLGQHAYKKPAMAIKHGEAYLTAYAARGDRAADNASIDFARANKKHLHVKEDVDIENVLDEALDLLMSIDEKTLTPAEMKKREEVVKAIKRDDPKMDKSMAYAIATKTAKRVAEGTVPTADEPTEHDKKMAQKVRDLLAKEKKPVKEEAEPVDEGIAAYNRYNQMMARKRKEIQPQLNRVAQLMKLGHSKSAAHEKAAAEFANRKSMKKEEVEQIDELSRSTLGSYAKKAMKDAPEKDRMGKAFSDLAGDEAKRGEREGASHFGKRAAQSYTKAANRRAGVEKAIDKMAKEELELEESAKIAAHLIKRYGDNVRKSHVRSAANDFGVGYVALAHAVRKKLKVNRLEEEQIDELSKNTLHSYIEKSARDVHNQAYNAGKKEGGEGKYDSGKILKSVTRQIGISQATRKLAGKAKVNANEETQIDELSKTTLATYAVKAKNQMGRDEYRAGVRMGARDGRGKEDEMEKAHQRRAEKRSKGIDAALDKLAKEETQIDEISAATKASYVKKASAEIDKLYDKSKTDARSAYKYYGRKNTMRKIANEEAEQIDEISAKKLTDYTAKASDARGHRGMPTAKLDKRYKSMALAHEKIRQRHAKVGATNEEVEELDELSNKTLSSYAKKATNQAFGKGVAGGAALASSDKETEAQGHKLVNKAAKRMIGAQKAIGKLTKEDIINRSIEKYVPEELKFTPEERLLKRLDGLSEAHVNTLLGLFEALNKDNQNRMIETVETREGINQILNFALENRGE